MKASLPIYDRDMSFGDYCEIRAANQSVLKKGIDGTPADMLAAMNSDDEPSIAMRFGTLFHTLLIEPDEFKKRFRVCEDASISDKRLKPWKAFAKESGEMNLDPVTWAEYQSALNMADAVLAVGRLGKYLTTDADYEASLLWRDPKAGVMCKARLDVVNHETRTIVDIKTATDASPRAFTKAVRNFGYGFQAAWYTEAARRVLGHEYRYLIVAVQKSAPFHVTVHEFTLDRLEWEHARCREMLDKYAECLEADEWPGYDDKVYQIALDPREVEQTTSVGGEVLTTTTADLGLTAEELEVLS